MVRGASGRGPLDFDYSSAGETYFVGLEKTVPLGPIVQRSIGISYLPNSLLKDGTLDGRREELPGLRRPSGSTLASWLRRYATAWRGWSSATRQRHTPLRRRGSMPRSMVSPGMSSSVSWTSRVATALVSILVRQHWLASVAELQAK